MCCESLPYRYNAINGDLDPLLRFSRNRIGGQFDDRASWGWRHRPVRYAAYPALARRMPLNGGKTRYEDARVPLRQEGRTLENVAIDNDERWRLISVRIATEPEYRRDPAVLGPHFDCRGRIKKVGRKRAASAVGAIDESLIDQEVGRYDPVPVINMRPVDER